MNKIRLVVKEFVETIVFALVLALIIRALFFALFWIPSASMVPTLNINDRLIVDRLSLGISNPLYDMNDSPVMLFNIPNPLYNTNFPLSGSRKIVSFGSPGRMEIIVFKYPYDPIGTRRDFIKRIVGLPGETVALKNGVVFINGKPFVETHTMNRDSFNMKPVKVPDKCYFMMGDNRPDSADSRYWGFITENDIIGRAVLRIWPLTQISLIPGK